MHEGCNSLADLLENCPNLVTIVFADNFLRGEVQNSFFAGQFLSCERDLVLKRLLTVFTILLQGVKNLCLVVYLPQLNCPAFSLPIA